MVSRYQGGDNAGHTIHANGEVYKLRLVPSGVLYPHQLSVIGNGVVVNPKSLVGELARLAEQRRDWRKSADFRPCSRDFALSY